MTLTPEMVEIEPCPFCGGEAEFVQDTSEAYVECTNDMCGACSGNFGYHSGDQKAQALAAWNARAQSQRAVGVDEFNEGDRVVWTNNHGTPFPATIYAKGIGYHLHLDDGTEITTAGKLRALIDRAGGGV